MAKYQMDVPFSKLIFADIGLNQIVSVFLLEAILLIKSLKSVV